ncbi:hypothetical protein [Photobacterium sanguinicancri]|uniref:hypothetical protein n=1 Tax=Photobacterium sanguinicancri TaxID=875932 RepID=UPI0026E2C4FB|nr:hypothetical protein [Photobacterium sanguinicancri]MDO6496978.1 hypothetical protein [Photobacterium sanguinicancri]
MIPNAWRFALNAGFGLCGVHQRHKEEIIDTDIRLNFRKYVLSEFAFVTALVGFIYLLSSGNHQQLQLLVMALSAGTVVKILMLLVKSRHMSLKVSNSHVFLNNSACDLTLRRSFLPYEMGSVIKVSYSVGVMQRRNIYLPKGVLNAADWKLILEHCT